MKYIRDYLQKHFEALKFHPARSAGYQCACFRQSARPTKLLFGPPSSRKNFFWKIFFPFNSIFDKENKSFLHQSLEKFLFGLYGDNGHIWIFVVFFFGCLITKFWDFFWIYFHREQAKNVLDNRTKALTKRFFKKSYFFGVVVGSRDVGLVFFH